MKNVKITNRLLMVNFEFPIEVGQVKLTAIGQAHVSKNSKTGELEADFDFIDQENETYMGMSIKGYDAWKKLKAFHLEFGVDLQKLIADEYDKVVTDEFQKEFLSEFDIKSFEV